MTEEQRKYQAHSYISTRGIHFEFDTKEEAKAFYEEGVAKGRTDFVLERTMVVWVKTSSNESDREQK